MPEVRSEGVFLGAISTNYYASQILQMLHSNTVIEDSLIKSISKDLTKIKIYR